MNYIDSTKLSLNNKNISFFLVLSLLLLCLVVPNASDTFLSLFDYPFINLMTTIVIIFVYQHNKTIAMLLIIFYILCIIQRRKNISRISVQDRINSIQITSDVKVNAVKDIIRENDISDDDKRDLVNKVINSNTSNNNKLRVILIFLRHCPEQRLLVLENLYALKIKQKNKIDMTKHIVVNKKNIPDTIKSIDNVDIPKSEKDELLTAITQQDMSKRNKSRIKKVLLKPEILYTKSKPMSSIKEAINESESDESESEQIAFPKSNIIESETEIMNATDFSRFPINKSNLNEENVVKSFASPFV